MAAEPRAIPLRCFLAIPAGSQFESVRTAVRDGALAARARTIAIDGLAPDVANSTQSAELARADVVIADISTGNDQVYFQIGAAQAMGKQLLLIQRAGSSQSLSDVFVGAIIARYEPSSDGLRDLTKTITQAITAIRRSPTRSRFATARRASLPFFVNWERLEPPEIDNLCRELMIQLGFRRIEWNKKGRGDFDLTAEFPRKDPDGYEYRELWFVLMGRKSGIQPEMLMEMSREPDYFFHRLARYEDRVSRQLERNPVDVPLTILVIQAGDNWPPEFIDELQRRLLEPHRRVKPFSGSIRFRIWDQPYLTSLIQQFPQIGYKYFSDEARAVSKYRKTPQELYAENVELTDRLVQSLAELEQEKNKRVRAERDAIWKEISFSAAHKIGNPIFAIETNLDPLIRRISETRTEEALDVAKSIRTSVDKAKGIIDQFKSLARTQKLSRVPTLLRPIIEHASQIAVNNGFEVDIACPDDLQVLGDPERLGECFDELSTNAVHMVDRSDRKLTVSVEPASETVLPKDADSAQTYVVIHFKDNGPGVEAKAKERIFDAFFTTRIQGTGLGLALVRRIMEELGGKILEVGIPGQGADFTTYLPMPSKKAEKESSNGVHSHSGR